MKKVAETLQSPLGRISETPWMDILHITYQGKLALPVSDTLMSPGCNVWQTPFHPHVIGLTSWPRALNTVFLFPPSTSWWSTQSTKGMVNARRDPPLMIRSLPAYICLDAIATVWLHCSGLSTITACWGSRNRPNFHSVLNICHRTRRTNFKPSSLRERPLPKCPSPRLLMQLTQQLAL